MKKSAMAFMLFVFFVVLGSKPVQANPRYYSLEEVCSTVPGWWVAETKTCTPDTGWLLYVSLLRIGQNETLVNHQSIWFLYDILENYGTIVNYGTFTNNDEPDYPGTGIIKNYATFTNYGDLTNSWNMYNMPGALVNNHGTFTNNHHFENWGNFISCNGVIVGILFLNYGEGALLEICGYIPIVSN